MKGKLKVDGEAKLSSIRTFSIFVKRFNFGAHPALRSRKYASRAIIILSRIQCPSEFLIFARTRSPDRPLLPFADPSVPSIRIYCSRDYFHYFPFSTRPTGRESRQRWLKKYNDRENGDERRNDGARKWRARALCLIYRRLIIFLAVR